MSCVLLAETGLEFTGVGEVNEGKEDGEWEARSTYLWTSRVKGVI